MGRVGISLPATAGADDTIEVDDPLRGDRSPRAGVPDGHSAMLLGGSIPSRRPARSFGDVADRRAHLVVDVGLELSSAPSKSDFSGSRCRWSRARRCVVAHVSTGLYLKARSLVTVKPQGVLYPADCHP